MENHRTVQACQMHVVRGKCWPAAAEVLSSSETQGSQWGGGDCLVTTRCNQMPLGCPPEQKTHGPTCSRLPSGSGGVELSGTVLFSILQLPLLFLFIQLMVWIRLQLLTRMDQPQDPKLPRSRGKANSPALAKSLNPGSGGRRRLVTNSGKHQQVCLWPFGGK